MDSLFLILHRLALALWLGAMVFFTFFIALPILNQLPELITSESSWLRKEMNSPPTETENQRAEAEAMRQKQGRRLSGEALNIVFASYFPFQAACAGAALFTGFLRFRRVGRRAVVQLVLIGLASAGALLNLFWFARVVRQLRLDRYSADPALASAADAAFQTWHNYSLWADLAGLACVFLAFVLAARERRIG